MIVTVRVTNDIVEVHVDDVSDVNESDVVSMVVVGEVVVVEDDSVEIHVLVDTVEGFVRSQPTSPKQSKMQPAIEMRMD